MNRGVNAGRLLEALLRIRGLTQAELAEKTGIPRTDINAYVKNRKRLGTMNGTKIADALDVEPDYFIAPQLSSPELERLQKQAEDLLHEVLALRRKLEEDQRSRP